VVAVCGRVLLIHDGRLVFDGPTTDLGGRAEEIEQKFHSLTGASV
jgi:ABC-2 type transport system ATP-binding protein